MMKVLDRIRDLLSVLPVLPGLMFLCAGLLLPSPLWADDDDCAVCHGDIELTRTLPGGTEQSLFVTGDLLLKSVHAEFSCVDCHSDLEGFDDFPHEEKLQPVQCSACHDDAADEITKGGHSGKLSCAACHGSHDILSPSDTRSVLSKDRINGTCADCHNKLHKPRRGRTAEYSSYDVGLHGRHPQVNTQNAPTCVRCHGTHAIACEDCSPQKLESACFECHQDIQKVFRTSVHADVRENRALSHCYQCHGEHRSRAPSDTTLRVLNETPAEATCGSCHAESVARYNNSLHAYALATGSPRAPRCESCHGAHNILRVDDPASPIHRSNQVATCAKCHSQVGIAHDPDIRMPRSFENYLESTHGKLLVEGNEDVPVCVDCHGGHSILASSNPNSTIALLNIDQTCGTCHPEQQKDYRTSIHYRALNFGITDCPTCTGCHGEHMMLSPEDPRSSVSHVQLSRETCGECHNDPVIIRKYGLAPNVVSTYNDSYHGLAIRAGYENAPSCSDCHLSHGIRTERDSLSTVYPSNLVKTCRQCHPKADASFAASYTHRALQPKIGGINYWVIRIYWVLIAVVIGGMILHNVVIINHYILKTHRQQKKGPKVVRFDTHQLIQHMALSVTFILLAVTGFALKYPDAWWVRWLSEIGLSEPVRRIVHRVMAVGLIATGVYHVVYLIITRRGRRELKCLLPDGHDVRDLRDSMRYHTGLGGKPPEYGRYDYSQKAEYWALIWGTILMIATGFVLWYPAELSPLLPRWAVSVCQTVHLYEAWLATLAIIVWHFFFVIFHPEEYPMSWTWLTGKMPLEQVERHHGRWYRILTSKGAEDECGASHPKKERKKNRKPAKD